MALYLVTGGCGFIGSNLAHALVARGERVRLLDDLSTGREVNVASLLRAHPQQAELWRGDVCDPLLLDRALVEVDYVLHQAAMPSVPDSFARPLWCERVNVEGTLQVLEAVRRRGSVRRVVFAASCAAYGDLAPEAPKRESDAVAPMSPYAISKLAGENYCAIYARAHGIPTVALRYFNVFGPRQDPHSQYAAVIPNFIRAALSGKSPVVYGDGLQSRDFCHVDNVVAANLLACTAPAEAVAGQVFNIGCGQAVTLRTLLETLATICGRPLQPQHQPPRAGEIRHSHADISLAQRLLGYQASVPFADGLRRTVAWYRENEQGASQPCAA